MDAQREVCVFCQQSGATPPEVTIMDTPAKKPNKAVDTAFLVVGIIAALVLVGGFGFLGLMVLGYSSSPMVTSSPQSEPAPSYAVRVETSPSFGFKGSYMVVSDGSSVLKSVEGEGTETYQLGTSAITSATFQKDSKAGFLKVSILRNGVSVKDDFTTAEYGVVSIAVQE